MSVNEDVQVLPLQDGLQEGLGRAEPCPVLGGRLHVREPVAGLYKELLLVRHKFTIQARCNLSISYLKTD